MKPSTPDYDVYLFHSGADAAIAEVVRQAFVAQKLSVFVLSDLEPGADIYDAIRLAIRNSQVFVPLVTGNSVRSPNLTFEYGAAWGISLPVFVLTNEVAPEELPSYLRRRPVFAYPAGLPALISAIQQQCEPFSDKDNLILAKAYRSVGVPMDQLTAELVSEQLVVEFERVAGRKISGTRLIRELSRLRKQRKLPRLTIKSAG